MNTKRIENMADAKKCVQCGAALPAGMLEGLCPACLLKQGATADSEPRPEGPPFEPPPVTEVARLFPQLEILALIGKGGMGAVYKARQPTLDRLVALKMLPPQTGGGADFAERFNREARALARLSHPNIVAVHEFGKVNGLHYFLMEYVDGVNLRQLEQAGRLSPREALQIIPQICDALQYAHDEGVVHRDIKPENVLVDRKGRVKIADFGLAKILGRESRDLRLTGEGQVMGTPHYMAPEQVEHPLAVDHRADIYSLGVVFYEMLTGELPLGKFAPPSKKVQVDVRLDEVVLHALEKEPERRYQHASEVKTDVETIAAAGAPAPVPASPAAPIFHVPRRLRDRWLWDPNIISLVTLVIVVGVAILVAALTPLLGLKALYLFLLDLVAALNAGIYLWVLLRMRRLREREGLRASETAEVIIAKQLLQTPGLALLFKDRLELIGIAGAPVAVPLEEIVAVRETRWFNGRRLWWKKALVLDRANDPSIAVALAAPVCDRWKGLLKGEEAPAAETEALPAISAPPIWVTTAALSLVVFFAGMALGGVAIYALPWGGKLNLVLFAVLVVALPFIAVVTNHHVRRWQDSPRVEERQHGTHWLKAWSGAAWILAVPVVGFGLFFLHALASESGSWNPAPAEAVLVPLTWLGSLLLPLSGWLLLWAARRTGAAAVGLSQREAVPARKPEVQNRASEVTPQLREQIRRQVKTPAIGLLATGILNWILIPLAVLFFAPLAFRSAKEAGVSQWVVLCLTLLPLVLCSFIIFAAARMMQLEKWGLAVAASILAAIVTPGNLVGLPAGIWSLAILTRREVREAFGSHQAGRSVPEVGPMSKHWLWILGTMVVLGIVAGLAMLLTSEKPDLGVYGHVTDAVTGKPVPHARVADNAYGAGARKAPRESWTDSRGRYSLETWPEEHTLAASAPRYVTKLATMIPALADREGVLRMDFRLEPTNRFIALLPDGEIELFAVNSSTSANEWWWRPDGRLMEGVEFLHGTPNRTGDPWHQFVVRVRGWKDDKQELLFAVEPARPSPGFEKGIVARKTKATGTRATDLWWFAAPMATNAQTASIQIGLPWDGWAKVASANRELDQVGEFRWPEGPEWNLKFHQATQAGANTTLILTRRLVPDSWTMRIEAVDTQAVEHLPATSTASGKAGQDYTWYCTFTNLSLGQVKEFVVQARPCHWVEFKNVALNPVPGLVEHRPGSLNATGASELDSGPTGGPDKKWPETTIRAAGGKVVVDSSYGRVTANQIKLGPSNTLKATGNITYEATGNVESKGVDTRRGTNQ